MKEQKVVHCDLKPENICARQTKEGIFNFTLTGLGNSAKLAKLGNASKGRVHRGNLIFSSLSHLETQRTNQLDDLSSLLSVAFFFIEGSLPWLDLIKSQPKQ